MQTNHVTSEIALAATCITLGFSKLIEALIKVEPVLAALSYIVAITAGVVSIYFKFKNKS